MSLRKEVAVATLLALLLPVAGVPASAAPPELRVYTWSEYVDQDVLDEFGRANGVTVTQHYFNSDSERDNRLAETDGQGYDVVTLNGPVIDAYRKRGWLAELPMARMPDLANAEARWRDAYPAARTHAVPYMVGTLGILYRADLAPAGIDSWMALFRPAPALCGRITMGGDARELINMALKALGSAAATSDPGHYRAAEELLLAQRPCVAGYRYPTIDGQSELDDRGRILAAMAFSSDASSMQEADPRLRYVVPREGGGLWVDYQAVLAGSRHREIAVKLLNHLHRPAIHARLAEFAYAMPTNAAASALLPADMQADRTIFPDPATLARSELDVVSTPEVSRLRNAIFARVVR